MGNNALVIDARGNGDDGDGSAPLYQETAQRLERLMDEGTYRAGDRLPSVRALHREWKISTSTVLEAYRILENRGRIEARPQSGYYVRPRYERMLKEPASSQPQCLPRPATAGDLVLAVLRDTDNKSLVQLGGAVPPPDLLPTEKLNRTLGAVLRRMGPKSNVYEMGAGAKRLRIELAKRATTAGCSLTPDDFVVTAGCQEAIFLCLRTLCEPGDAVAVESPYYYGLVQLLEGLRIQALEIPTHPRDGMSLEALRYALDHHKVKAVLACTNYSNPLGTVIPDERKIELVELLARREIPLIEDDVYGETGYTDQRPSVAKAHDRHGLVLLCSSVSKTLAPGWRLGWVAPGRFRDQLLRIKAHTNLATNTPMQHALAEFLENGGYDHHLRKMRRMLHHRMNMLREAVWRHFPAGTRTTRPAGGYVLWVELPEQCDAVDAYMEAHAHGITIAPGPMFSSSEDYRNCLRLNCAWYSEELEWAVQRLGEILARQTTATEPAGP